jgi:hypothetical protein
MIRSVRNLNDGMTMVDLRKARENFLAFSFEVSESYASHNLHHTPEQYVCAALAPLSRKTSSIVARLRESWM